MKMQRYGNKSFPSPTTHDLQRLARYLITRPDLYNADIGQVEAALKQAGQVRKDQDHFYTAMHAMLRLLSIRRRVETDMVAEQAQRRSISSPV